MKKWHFVFLGALFLIVSILAEPIWAKPYKCEDDLIEVMFAQDAKVRMRKGDLVDLATNAVSGVETGLKKLAWHQWERICDIPEEKLDEIQARGEANTGMPVYNLNNIYRLRIPKGLDVWAISRDLAALPGIIYAQPVPKPMSPPAPNYFSYQGYLNRANLIPSGIDAIAAWTKTGGTGTGVTVCDLEYSWNYNHADITKAPGSQINPNPIADPFSDTDHGTAVIGELVSDNNGWGTTGICYGASLKTCGTFYPASNPEWNVAGAIAYAIANLSAGDVILLEAQWDWNESDTCFIPIEFWGMMYPMNMQNANGVYEAIVNAVSNGIHVVEAGGNGNVNTDRFGWYPQKSGAIIVGAGGASSGNNLQRLPFSSYGSRFDLQAWGEDVYTTGYGDLWNYEGINYFYTSQFSGTSSASAMVAGAVACCVGYGKAQGVNPTLLNPGNLRNVLVETGTPQDFSQPGNIGPRPNLRAAFTELPKNISLAPAVSYDVTGSPYSVFCADLDNDGDLDIAAADQFVSILKNNGDGTFQPKVDYAAGNAPTAVFCADLNRDGYLDLVVTNTSEGSESVAILMNNGDGTFSAKVEYPTEARPYSVFCADLDGDGDVDLAVSNEINSTVSIFKNNGDGTFQPKVDYGVGAEPYSVSGGDLDGDGDVDLATANWGGYSASVLINNGDGTFQPNVDCGTGWAPFSIFCADLDGDGDLDLATANTHGGVSILKNNGDGTFQGEVEYGGGTHPYSVFCADLDGDGNVDLVLSGTSSSWGNISTLRNRGGGTFPIDIEYLAGNGAHFVYCADLDGDLDLDLVAANNSANVSVLINLSNRAALGTISGVVKDSSTGQNLQGVYVEALHWGLIKGISVTDSNGQYSITNLPPGAYNVRASKADYETQTLVGKNVVAAQTTTVNIQLVRPYVSGDANGDGKVTVSDAIYSVNYLFKGGPPPDPLQSGDANCDGHVNVSDIVYIINYLFRGGPPPGC